MKSYVILPKIHQREIPEKFQTNDNRTPENLVEYLLQHFTNKGDLVLDIFAGLGTTLFVSEKMGRIPYGIEYNKERYEYVQQNLQNKNNIFLGDSLQLLKYNLPKCDFCFSSPPFMMKHDKENPFTDCSTQGSYLQYLEDIKKIYTNLREVMKENAFIVIDCANLKDEDGNITTLAWDVSKKISEVLYFIGEIIILWEKKETTTVDGQSEPWRIAGTFGYGYDHSYCSVFQKKSDF